MFSRSEFREAVKSMGLVFGDIGTSPIYTLTVIFLLTKPTEAHIIGVLSLFIWTLVIIVTMEYAWLAMSLSHKGEGGTIVLKEIIIPLLKNPSWGLLVNYHSIHCLLFNPDLHFRTKEAS
ncbi:MAG TPA: KUP/HAK/KT family potassium transporter [Methanosarcina sp.]|jgi:KUP system potassium uptake protein|nr:KUP/HAK/KT family potassium transporter [Methanosarcina sp.]HOW13200.1 KUP/HAK/KT family potassium transporter [Methanosarcina sp.]